MEFRTAFTTALALFGAAVAVSACELLDDEPLFCAPKLPPSQDPPQEQDPQCTECIEDRCGNAGENCSGECKEYGECTCECDEEDDACFDLCLDGKSEECRSCEDASANALLSCVMEQCKVCLGGGPMDGSDGSDPSATDPSGDPSWSDSGDPSGTDTGDPGGEDTGGGMACETLHSQCCPNLEGVDLELCETATDELSCEIWLDIFQEEGKC
jgi:hypothetical protein